MGQIDINPPDPIPGGNAPSNSVQQPENRDSILVTFNIEAKGAILLYESKGTIKVAANTTDQVISFGGVTNATFIHLKAYDFLNKTPKIVVVTLNSTAIVNGPSEFFWVAKAVGTAITTVKVTTPNDGRACLIDFHIAGV